MIRNRDTWTITHLHPDGALTATGRTGTVRLPADYVAEHVELGYAQTSHATQRRTVDHAYLVLDGPCDTRGLYVPLTRGRHSNHAYITTTGDQTPAEVLTGSLTRTWIDEPAVAHRDRLERHPGTAGRSTPGSDQGRGRKVAAGIIAIDARLQDVVDLQEARRPPATQPDLDLGIDL